MNPSEFEEKLNNCDWKSFEKLINSVLKLHDYESSWNVHKTLKRKRRQYDVIARKYDKVLLIECKNWATNRYKNSQYKRAVMKHLERCAFFKNFTKKQIIPIIVSCHNEDIKWHMGVPIIPSHSLNSFLNNIEKYELEKL